MTRMDRLMLGDMLDRFMRGASNYTSDLDGIIVDGEVSGSLTLDGGVTVNPAEVAMLRRLYGAP